MSTINSWQLRTATAARSPTPKTISVSGTQTGSIVTVTRMLGASSTLSLTTATHSNLTLSGSAITAASALANTSQTAVVREALNGVAIEYPITLAGNSVAIPVQAPSLTAAPVISGNTTTGSTLTTTNGSWTNSPTSYTFQWQRAGVAISGATSSTYVLASADATKAITCIVSAANSAGSASATSNTITASVLAPGINDERPTISGSATVGSTLTTTNGTWFRYPTSYSFQWLRNGSPISEATANTYTLVGADAGTSITSSVTATNAGGSTTSTSSNSITIAVATNPTFTAAPVISGDPHVGSVLTVTSGTVSNGTVTGYQWCLADASISGATASSYTPSQPGTYTCKVTASNSNGSTTFTTSFAVTTPVFNFTNANLSYADGTLANTIPGLTEFTGFGSYPQTIQAGMVHGDRFSYKLGRQMALNNTAFTFAPAYVSPFFFSGSDDGLNYIDIFYGEPAGGGSKGAHFVVRGVQNDTNLGDWEFFSSNSAPTALSGSSLFRLIRTGATAYDLYGQPTTGDPWFKFTPSIDLSAISWYTAGVFGTWAGSGTREAALNNRYFAFDETS